MSDVRLMSGEPLDRSSTEEMPIREGGSGGGGGTMLEEMKKQITSLEAQVSILKATVATKEDLHRELNATTGKYIGWMFAVMGFYTGVSLLIAKVF